MTNEEIDKLCNRYDITNYTINNGVVDVDGSVQLFGKRFTELPLKFGSVTGNFDCSDISLTTLEGSPHTVGGGFLCYMNKLTSLEHSPVKVGENFDVERNQITSLIGCPKSIGDEFIIEQNNITCLDDLPNHLGGRFHCSVNPIGSIFDNIQLDFLEVFKMYKVIKDNQVNLKRLKYVMGLFDKNIRLESIKRNYTII